MKIILYPKSTEAFKFFEEIYFVNPQEEIQRCLIKLLDIDAHKTIYLLLKMMKKNDQRKKLVRDCINIIEKEKERAEPMLLKFLDAIFEYNVEEYQKLIDEETSRRQFTLYIKHDSEKLMSFLQKIDYSRFRNLPEDSEDQCAQNGLYVEQAFILFEKDEKQKGIDILLS